MNLYFFIEPKVLRVLRFVWVPRRSYVNLLRENFELDNNKDTDYRDKASIGGILFIISRQSERGWLLLVLPKRRAQGESD